MQVILASSSPRRKELMEKLNIPFSIVVRDVPEIIDKEIDCYHACMNIARAKAQSVFNETNDNVIVIGSDTIVSLNGKIYGKPKDYEDAYKMISSISGTKHEVISSVCVLIRKNNRVYEELTYDKCDVYVSKMTHDEIDDWINKNDVYTRAGGYAIQDGFGKFVEKIEGDYFSIVGFPLHKVYDILKKNLNND